MVRFLSEWHPELIIRDLGVRFRDGVAEVDATLAAVVRELPAELGIREADPDGADVPTSPDRGAGTTADRSTDDPSAATVKPRRSGRR